MSQTDYRFFCEILTEPTARLSPVEAHHLTGVLRLAVGEKVELFDGKGRLVKATITTAKKRNVILEIERSHLANPRQNQRIILATSIPKTDRFDWLVAKATELDVDRITPVIFNRTVKLPNNPKILTRWHNIAISSAKQCKRLFLPQIDTPIALTEAIDNLKTKYPDAQLLLADPNADDSLAQLPKKDSDTIIFIGPEGGIKDDEQQLLIEKGAKPVRLTSTILRVETAAITAAAIISTARDV